MKMLHSCLAAVALMSVSVAAASAQSVPAMSGSSAYGLSGNLASRGTVTWIGDLARTAGAGIIAYARRSSVPLFSESLGLVANGNVIGLMSVVSSGLASHVSNSVPAGATAQTEGDAGVASVDMALSLMPTLLPGGSGEIASAPLLTLSATNVVASTTVTKSQTAANVATGTASFASFTLSGSLVGNKQLTFSGSAPANTVLYADPYLTVTLNQQVITGAVACTPTCLFLPKGMVSYAIAVQMTKEPIAGRAADATFFVGATQAAMP